MDLGTYKSDLDLELQGVTIALSEDAWVKVARANNKNFVAEVKRLGKIRKHQGRGQADSKKIDEDLARAIAKTIWVGMGGLVDSKGDFTTAGELIPDTEEMRFQILMHPEYADFRVLIANHSSNWENFSAAEDEEDLGKSETGSNGPGRGADTAIV